MASKSEGRNGKSLGKSEERRGQRRQGINANKRGTNSGGELPEAVSSRFPSTSLGGCLAWTIGGRGQGERGEGRRCR